MERKTNEETHNFWAWFFAIMVIFWIWVKVQVHKKEPYITTRKTLSKLYKVDLKTFNKWVRIFSDPAIITYNSFTKQRGVTQKQKKYLLELFGSPKEDKRKYSKAYIVAFDDDELEHTEYRSGRESLRKFLDKYNITPEIYAQLNFFPPRIGHELKRQMGC